MPIVGLSLLILALGWTVTARAASAIDVYTFPDEAEKARYKALIAEFRCPKCLNTNIAGSDAPIAQDLRRTVHRLVVVEKRSNDEVRSYLHERYGDFVLYDPPFNARTGWVWILPVVLLGIGGLLLFVMVRRARSVTQPEMTAEQRSLVEEVLNE